MRPLSLFVLWWGVVLVFAYGGAGTVVFLKTWLQANPWVTAGLPDRLSQLSLARAAAALVPFLVALALHSLMLAKAFTWFGARAVFKVHLNIAAYASGAYAAIQVLAVVAEMHLWFAEKTEPKAIYYSRSVIFLGSALICVLSLLFLLRAMLRRQKRATDVTWPRVFAANTLALTMTACALFVLLLGLQPLTRSL